MKYFIFLCLVIFFIGSSSLNAQQRAISSLDENANSDLLVKDWSKHEANAFGKKEIGIKDSIVFDFNFKDALSGFMDHKRSNKINSEKKTVEMPVVRPSGNYPMTVYPIDSTKAYSLRIYKY
ncbi:hypothetical protein [Arenibacter sp. ARW7G5Y1]|uniref:hypothetical protein n=1 Tax=Arenibacter sp. ARW7G5Y1 TaxID=2135619 RepID=UPI000D771D6F|nr:hypothetical protein [Arenibacter sp. ARW7G5Y1]PXX25249.1 hypothetical protein C7972_113126 [Arenibacter sp. ARW7G5Y1]